MKVLKTLSFSIFIAVVSFSACTSDVETLDTNMLYGHWTIKSAQRDGRPTETLASTFFKFSKDGNMVTNFNLDGNEITEAFEIEGFIIKQKGDTELNFSVEKLEENQLVLLTKLMKHDFTLNLEKAH